MAMDIIDYGVRQEPYLSEKGKIKEQAWIDFEQEASGKRLFLFGTGAGTAYFFSKYKNKYHVTGILDNDERWHGFTAGDIIVEACDSVNEKAGVMPVSSLDSYRREEILVLITSTKYYKEMAEQLLNLGVTAYYVLLMMEANRRRQYPEICEATDINEEMKAYAEICCKRPIQWNKIVFRSFDTYSDHGKYITEQLLKRSEELDIVWILRDLQEEVPEGVRTVWTGNWKKHIYEMETAHIWVINTLMPSQIIKREGQIYIHTKHWASITLKKFYLDASTITDVPADVERWRHNGECMDYVLTGSEFDAEAFRRGFEFRKEAVQVGSSRTDAMFRPEECRSKVIDHYHLERDHRFLLYAPTYRYSKDKPGVHSAEARNIGLDYAMIRNALSDRFGGEWDILLRLHPSVARESGRFAEGSYVVDVSAYPDSEELASASDIMISDYSSIMFEPAFVKKPVFLFATDKAEYIDHEYDLLLNYDALPFPIAETNGELAQYITKFDQTAYESRVTAFLDQYGVREDGHASERAAEFILYLFHD